MVSKLQRRHMIKKNPFTPANHSLLFNIDAGEFGVLPGILKARWNVVECRWSYRLRISGVNVKPMWAHDIGDLGICCVRVRTAVFGNQNPLFPIDVLATNNNAMSNSPAAGPVSAFPPSAAALDEAEARSSEARSSQEAETTPASVEANPPHPPPTQDENEKAIEANPPHPPRTEEAEATQAAVIEPDAAAKPAEVKQVQVLLDGGWRDSTPEETQQICEHVARGERQFQIKARGQFYDIILDSPDGSSWQTNKKTGKRRQMRLMYTDSSAGPGADGPVNGKEDGNVAKPDTVCSMDDDVRIGGLVKPVTQCSVDDDLPISPTQCSVDDDDDVEWRNKPATETEV